MPNGSEGVYNMWDLWPVAVDSAGLLLLPERGYTEISGCSCGFGPHCPCSSSAMTPHPKPLTPRQLLLAEIQSDKQQREGI